MPSSAKPGPSRWTADQGMSTDKISPKRQRGTFGSPSLALPADVCTKQKKPERACKPGSVESGHFSRMMVAHHLQQPTRTFNGSGRSAAAPSRRNRPASCLVLLPVGFTEPNRSPGPLVRSYRTVSPLPPGKVFLRENLSRSAVCFLWHFPYPRGRWALPTTVPCGARTFLSPALGRAATTQPAPVTPILRSGAEIFSISAT